MNLKFILLYFAALANIAYAASQTPQELLGEIPSCSLPCMISEIPKSGCSFTNTTCLCSSSLATPALKTCILSACNTLDALKLDRAQVGFCGLVSDKSRQTTNLVVLLVFLGLVTVFIAIRVWIRITPIFKFWVDDWLVLVAFALNIVYAVLSILQAHAGSMQHIEFLSDNDITQLTKLSYIEAPITALAPAFTKLSILAFLLRIFPNQRFLLACKIMIAFVIVNSIAMAFVSIFQCIPIRLSWEAWRFTDQPKSCINVTVFALAGSFIYMMQDVMILLMPLPIILKLQLNRVKKLKLVFIFTAGLITTIFSILRFPAYIIMTRSRSTDPFWDIAPTLLYTTLEISVGIICACFPAANAALSHFFPTIFGTEAGSSASKNLDGSTAPYIAGSKPKSADVCNLDQLSSKGLILTENEIT